jgi:alpha-ketoglutarate-dependent taurine dioxygenase
MTFGYEYHTDLRNIKDNIGDFQDDFIKYRLLIFRNLQSTEEEQLEITNLFMFGKGNRDHTLIDITHEYFSQSGRLEHEDPDTLVGQWHVDNAVHEYSPTVVTMLMDRWVGEHGTGNTIFIDLEGLFQICPDHFKSKLEHLELLHQSGQDDADGNHASGAVHPLFRIHPITGNTILFYTGPDLNPVDGPTAEFDEFKDWISLTLAKVLDDGLHPQMKYEMEWNQGDMVLMDNRCILHGFRGGWKIGERSMRKTEGQWVRP